jgi:hypothetical protein
VRFFFAIVCFVLAAASMGLGIAQRTVFAGPDQVSASTTAKSSSPVVVIDGSALNAYPHTQNVQLSGSSKTFAAYGRTSDVMAWVGSASYTRVTFDSATGKLVSRVHTGKSLTVPNPSGSDLWLGQYTGSNAQSFHLKAPKGISVLAVSNGKSPAPATVSISWPIDNSTPWSGPLIIGGGGVLLLGLILLLWAFTHLRRTRGPRRTQPRMPKLPRQPRYKPSRGGAVSAAKGRRAIRRMVAATPALALATLALAGCSVLPGQAAPTPTPTQKAAETSNLQQTAVTSDQFQHILQRVSSVIAKADTDLDPKLAATRLAGPALEDRTANYSIRTADSTIAPSVAIPDGSIRLTLPQANNSWPRTVFAVVASSSAKTAVPLALMLVQNDPRSNYKVNYAMTLQPKAKLPEVAPASVGASRLPPSIKLLKIQPSALAVAYGDVLLKDTASPSAALFDAKDDTFRTQVGLAAKNAEIAKLPTTAALTFSNAEGDGQVIALATNDSGALVAVDLNEVETVKPVKAGAAVSASGAIKALSGKATSLTGLAATYGDQLLFYVPRADKPGKIVLLGFSQGLIAASEVS